LFLLSCLSFSKTLTCCSITVKVCTSVQYFKLWIRKLIYLSWPVIFAQSNHFFYYCDSSENWRDSFHNWIAICVCDVVVHLWMGTTREGFF
jgi:hypothetical protein